jgi:hypothetical protein
MTVMPGVPGGARPTFSIAEVRITPRTGRRPPQGCDACRHCHLLRLVAQLDASTPAGLPEPETDCIKESAE